MNGEPEIVKNFILKTLRLQSWAKKIDQFQLGEGVMKASFKVLHDRVRYTETLMDDFGESAIGRVAPVDSGFWWIILLRTYTKSAGDTSFADMPECQKGMRLILSLCLSEGFDTFPTLLCADGCSMIDRRMIKSKPLINLDRSMFSWAYQTILPPPPKLCGSPGGPPVTAPRIKLRDGRHLAYKEHGVDKETANYKIILVHGFSSSRHATPMTALDVVKELGVSLVSFDRPGYGESDPDPNRNRKSLALDIEELADQLELGSKFYVIGISMGGQAVWGCLKYIPHRLKGAALLAPVVNYWWPGFPANLSKQAYEEQYLQDQWALRVAHYAPWLTYWWNTQKLFPASSVVAGNRKLSRQDIVLSSKLAGTENYKDYVTQQGIFESKLRDMMVGFGKWEFDPMDLENPFVDGEGSVHLWQGDEDGLVPVTLQRYIVDKLPWIEYHEIAGAGHLFPHDDAMGEAVLRTLLLGDKWP